MSEITVQEVIEDLRLQADNWNQRSMVEGTSHEMKTLYRTMHQEFRRMANKYEKGASGKYVLRKGGLFKKKLSEST